MVERPGRRETVDAEYLPVGAARLTPRPASQQEIVAAVAYLSSDSAWLITSQTLMIDGGPSGHVLAPARPVTMTNDPEDELA